MTAPAGSRPSACRNLAIKSRFVRPMTPLAAEPHTAVLRPAAIVGREGPFDLSGKADTGRRRQMFRPSIEDCFGKKAPLMLPRIDHVVVLMLENRSFDCMLGRLYGPERDFRGLIGTETNDWQGQPRTVWTSGPNDPPGNRLPNPDPNEKFADMTAQIFGATPSEPPVATMGGFAANYAALGDPLGVMHGFTPEQLPVLSTLAKAFAVSDDWHASAPNQTWPNRFFAHTGTANGYVNNDPLHIPYMMPTIFNRLAEANRSWRVYYHDMPQAATLTRIWSQLPDHLYLFEDHFMADAMAGRLPSYSFIEPRYFSCPALSRMPNDQHPPHDVNLGERLIARCYDAIRNGAAWERTLFVITYDEHGGIYDHVPPPAAVRPDDKAPDGFAFDRYGVRVPAVIISPWIRPETIARRPDRWAYPFDHTSILATLRNLFDLGDPLTERDAAAPDLLHLLDDSNPANPGPPNLALPTDAPLASDIAAAHDAAPNGMQEALAKFAPFLPPGTANIPDHLDAVKDLAKAAHPRIETVRDALAKVELGMSRFLHGGGSAPAPAPRTK